MAVKYRGQIPLVDPNNPQSWGKDDITGLPVMHPDMVKQMEWGPQGLYWTGFMVHFKDADEPNPQLVPPRLKPDPLPILNPRHFYRPELPNVPTGLAVVSITSDSIEVTWDLVTTGNISVQSYVISCFSQYTLFTFEGIIAPPYTIQGLAPLNEYTIQIASTNNDIGTSSFSYPPILATTS